ncbi:MAG: c-type cytochrome [Flavobacteriales bacterium]|nr:c-type cytochrome [Flavobacteriales bacterium]
MKTLVKILKRILLALLLIIGILIVFVFARQSKTYDAPFPEITAVQDSAVLARGEYLVYGPAHCSGCHSPLDKQQALATGEHIPLEGGFIFPLPIGELQTPNITPDPETGIGKITDQQIARALRYGVGYDGRPLFDFMPFHNLSDDDLQAVISYLRQMPAVKKEIPKKKLNFLGKVIYALMIEPIGPEQGIEIPKSIVPDSSVKYGEYLSNYVANCRGCHTNRDLKTGAYIGEFYAGGFAMPSTMKPGKAVVSPNLTQDPQTGRIVGWSEEKFIQRIRQGRTIPLSEMPWDQFQQMSDTDLKAIYAYLQTIKPVQHDTGPAVIDLPN